MLLWIAIVLWGSGVVLVLISPGRQDGSAMGLLTFAGLMLGAVVGVVTDLLGTAAALGGGAGLVIGALWDRRRDTQP